MRQRSSSIRAVLGVAAVLGLSSCASHLPVTSSGSLPVPPLAISLDSVGDSAPHAERLRQALGARLAALGYSVGDPAAAHLQFSLVSRPRTVGVCRTYDAVKPDLCATWHIPPDRRWRPFGSSENIYLTVRLIDDKRRPLFEQTVAAPAPVSDAALGQLVERALTRFPDAHP